MGEFIFYTHVSYGLLEHLFSAKAIHSRAILVQVCFYFLFVYHVAESSQLLNAPL